MLVSPLALSDIARDFCKTDYFPAFVSHGIQDGKRPEFAAVLADAPSLGLETSLRRGGLEGAFRGSLLLVLRSKEACEGLGDDFLGPVPLQAGCPGVPGNHSAVPVDHVDRIIYNRINQQLQSARVAKFAQGIACCHVSPFRIRKPDSRQRRGLKPSSASAVALVGQPMR